jgi:TP901 family phage tail tape measure protein
MYSATRSGTMFSSMLVTQPVATLKAFAAETNKAALAAEYFKSQLQFLAASRFGTIIIWGAILGGITSAMEAVVSASVEMDSAVHRVASAFVDSGNAASFHNEIQRKLVINAIAFGKTYKETAEIMWELKSAGLSVNQTYASMDAVQKLIYAGAQDINTASRITAGLYKQFGNEVKGATTEQQRFNEIAGTLAFINIKSQATIDTLMQSYKYAGAIAKASGVSFNELSAAIGVANNAMLYASTAGTGLSQAILSAIKNYKELARISGLAFDPQKPLQFSAFIHALAQNQDLVNKKIGAMGELAKASNVRGLRALLALVQGVKEYDELLARLNEGNLSKFLDDVSGERMDAAVVQWNRLKETMKSLILTPIAGGFASFVKPFNDANEAAERLADGYRSIGESAFVANAKAMALVYGFRQMGKSAADALEIAKQAQEGMINQGVKEGNTYAIQQKLNQALNARVKTFEELLRLIPFEEQLYERTLITGGKVFEQHVAHLNAKIEKEKQAAVDAQGNEEKVIQHLNKAIELERQLQQYKDSNTSKNRTEAEKNLAAMEKAAEVLTKSKVFTPAEEILANNRHLEVANQRLISAKFGTEEWRKATHDVADAALKVLNNFQAVEKAVQAALSATSSLIATQKAYSDYLKSIGEGGAAKAQLDDALRAAEATKYLAINKKEEAAAQAEITKALQAQAASGLYDPRISAEIKASFEKQIALQKELAELEIKKAEAAKAALKDAPEKAVMAAQITKAIDDWNKGIMEAHGSLSNNFNKGLTDTDKLVQKISGGLTTIATQLKEMPAMPTMNLTGEQYAPPGAAGDLLARLGQLKIRGME